MTTDFAQVLMWSLSSTETAATALWTCRFMLAPIIDRAPDIAVGARFSGKSNRGALPWHESFGNRLAAGLIRLLHGVNVSDLSPFRSGRADALHALALKRLPTVGLWK